MATKRTVRSRTATGDLQKLRQIIANGEPWTRKRGELSGYSDVYELVSGHFYDCTLHYCHEHDEDSQRALWEELKDDIVREHLKYSPGTRPWAWWKWEAPEMRRVVGVDRDPDDDDGTECPLPAFEDLNLPERFKDNYFGCPNVYDGHIYESELDYLKRHKLLLPEERNAQQKSSRKKQNGL
jgi:hypothetical protein